MTLGIAKRTVHLVLAGGLVLSASVFSAPRADAAWLGQESRVTTNPAFQTWPELSGTKLVYQDYRNVREVGDPNDPDQLYDIRVRDLTSGKDRNLTPHHTAIGRPAISGNKVVWNDYGYGRARGGIYYHNLATGTHKRLPVPGGAELEISGNRICYEASNRIYVYDLKTRVATPVSPARGSAGACDISGTKVVWQDHRSGTDFDIYSYDLATRIETRLTKDPTDQGLPKISGNNVVWHDQRNGALNTDIYLYNLATKVETRVTDAAGLQWFPNVSGNRIVWMDERNGDTDVYLYDAVTKVETRVTDNPFWSGNPVVSGGRIVYEDNRGGDLNLYLRVVTVPKVGVVAPAAVDYGNEPVVTGTLAAADGTPVAGQQVQLEYSTDRGVWHAGNAATTSVVGAFSVNGPALTAVNWLRVRYAGSTDYPAAVSAELRVRARLEFSGPPALPTISLTKAVRYPVMGTFLPKHSSRSHQITVRSYRWQGGEWVYQKSFSTLTSNPTGASETTYRGSVRLTKAGQWRIRAYHRADTRNATTFSPYLYLSVG